MTSQQLRCGSRIRALTVGFETELSRKLTETLLLWKQQFFIIFIFIFLHYYYYYLQYYFSSKHIHQLAPYELPQSLCVIIELQT